VGNDEGTIVGTGVGGRVGRAVGNDEGTIVGTGVGVRVGRAVGIQVVGASVGAEEGFLVFTTLVMPEAVTDVTFNAKLIASV
jgi:hypothetical protein